MNTNIKTELIKSDDSQHVRPVSLVQEKLARSILLIQIDTDKNNILNAICNVLKPLQKQDLPLPENISLKNKDEVIKPQKHDIWFALNYERKILALLKIDRATLDQLASSFYGGKTNILCSPLREANQSEYRLGLKLISSVLNTMNLKQLDKSQLSLSLYDQDVGIEIAASWTINFPIEYPVTPMLFAITDSLVQFIIQKPINYEVDQQLNERLKTKSEEIPLKLDIELGRDLVSMSSITNLTVGDVIPMNINSQCSIKLGSKNIFHAEIHNDEGQLVAKINQDLYAMKEAN